MITAKATEVLYVVDTVNDVNKNEDGFNASFFYSVDMSSRQVSVEAVEVVITNPAL
jgi:hypothetical protein